jgi:hypothetical protein
MTGSGKYKKSGRKYGRPSKGDIPRVPYEELDRILVFGEVVPCEDGESNAVQYPSYRDLASRYNVSNSLIADFSKRHNCLRRRKEAQARVAAKVDQKLVEFRSTALALSKEDELRIIDSYLAGFEKAMAEERVRFDNPSDFNTMVRLKEFIQGGADSRQEIHAALSLEDIQARHKRMMQEVESTSAKERGEINVSAAPALPAQSPAEDLNPPALSIDGDTRKVTGHFLNTSSGEQEARSAVAPTSATCGQPPQARGEGSPFRENGRQGAAVGDTGQSVSPSKTNDGLSREVAPNTVTDNNDAIETDTEDE